MCQSIHMTTQAQSGGSTYAVDGQTNAAHPYKCRVIQSGICYDVNSNGEGKEAHFEPPIGTHINQDEENQGKGASSPDTCVQSWNGEIHPGCSCDVCLLDRNTSGLEGSVGTKRLLVVIETRRMKIEKAVAEKAGGVGVDREKLQVEPCVQNLHSVGMLGKDMRLFS
ncbi:hypothetical protein IFM89_007146 [Coptis chinensis]|uniref:Uncharacterized protein n=1 Tax=Coptis chinensis TaxID=261450 RepID=A0A835LHT4_9MAGN|nr:hypothetical protein IFM89_007146 [Coptis chinensis]